MRFTLGLGEFEIGFQRTNDILDEGMEAGLAQAAPAGDGASSRTPADRAEFSLELDMLYGGQVNAGRRPR